MFKDRTSGTIVFVAVIAIVIMGVALIASSQNKPLVPSTSIPPTAPAVSLLATSAPPAAPAANPTGVALATSAVGSDVQTTASGLQYRVIKQGTGPKPKATDTVTVNYRGILTNGTEFDSSFSRNQPTTFPLNGVIPGWTEGVQLMPVGSSYIFTIPGNLAYGANPPPNSGISPNATLIFQIDLLSIG